MRPTPASFRLAKPSSPETGPRLVTLTATDYPSARLLEESGLVHLLLVGDSLGMVALGYPDTTHVTLDDIRHHLRAVRRGAPRSLIVADLPFRTYEDDASALASSRLLLADGADAVKLEGGAAFAPRVNFLVQAGVPVMGHIGMLPQSIHAEGGKYRLKGKTPAEAGQLLADAIALAQAGAFSLVLELVSPAVARHITAAVPVPTIGIGSGPRTCDGDILVTHDLVGLFPWFRPKFALPASDLAQGFRHAIAEFHRRATAPEDESRPPAREF